ncbi:DNA-directed RNA polymerase I subunit RPA1-like [Cucumis melo var. makuwa]|uniref:DNA-directed RNA polymerase I subunit RPA1-like n=2 Tax=Cucumis melo var. makuwa TaxID=1194695 RepID=A0A5A7U911_CUCMM|nr:DNA-directed RNA polymerase I subunit RPA1-like [Cucumis melo var. makuwa]
MALLFSLEGSTELTLEFSGLAVGLVGESFLSLVTVQYVVKHWSGCCSWSLDGEGQLMRASFGSTRLICASFGSTRLMCASFGSTRLMCASFGSTRLICASLGSTRLICAFYGTTRLLCRVGAQRGADRREAGRMREGHMDASGFLIASAMYFVRIFCLVILELVT